MDLLKKALLYFLKGIILLYRYTLSSFMGRNCRFMPSCSEYALEALEIHGPFQGGWLALKRILRCNPWGGEGYDPVPKNKNCGCKSVTSGSQQD